MANTVEFLGMGSVRYGTSITSQTIFFPATAQDGDFLVLQAFADREYPSVPSGWTVQFSTYLTNYEHFIIATKVKEAGESNVKITTTSPTGIYGVVSAYKNVKSVAGVTGRQESERLAYSPLINDFSVNQTDTLALILSSFNNANYMTITPPNGFTTLEQKVGTGCRFHISGRQMGSETSLSRAQTSTQTSASAWVVGCFLLMLEPVKNAPPTISLTSPSDNQTLSEGNALPVAGEASDADANNNVVIKCQINNGPIRNIGSGVSDGVTPISFARTLTYHNKRLWDGAMDVAGADLAEDVDHILKVWAEDDQGGKSAEVTRKFRVIWNRPPVISGANEDLGKIMEPPSKTYSVTDPEGNPFTITEKIDGKAIRSFEGVPGREETITIPHDMWIRLDLDTPHELTIEATDNNGLTSTRTFTFIREETHIEFMLNFDNPDIEAHFTLDGMPKRVLVTLDRYLPPGSQIEFVRVTNNAMDETPTWEDMTAAVNAGRGYLFTNQQKTAANWRINIWVRIAKGTATERVRLDGFGGAFD